ncbi:uncharacterized protein TrAtP1_010093 [Trichoderma atroviride]|uniref:F-box domain-containing protein n=1 Tax=Hypocrea atroviridis (strain ATCC 20476 / IMI 206040) TaxID=452589 RepID=G9NQA5_HYPAI|nr:uncharacterized protein TRIATDRAFT_45637 [Trichoderma atroviride IMI 206040]EHK47250.1 hypothetical protein TRIATDRAFT_45637 [Trichoderma atroviride IMI 206040]UKZ69080.1 hypothetical protein TrAtP1_010093 [Trichoderma atroviride]
MASLSALPPELASQVFQLLEAGDIISLSVTCKYWRAQLAPDIFRAIRLTNDERVARSVLSAVEAHGQYTTSIEFKSRCGLNAELMPPALPPAAVKVLQGHLTPNLKTVSINFDYDYGSDEAWDTLEGGSIYVFRDAETEEYIREREEAWQWRALMNETWRALAANMHVRELIIDNFVTKWTSAFRTQEFRQFLSRLESASFDFLGLDNGAGWRTNTMGGYLEFISELDSSFFHHMTGLKHLTIIASDPIGLEGHNHTPLALNPGDLPLLESLKIRRCFVGPELVSFIEEHAQVLKSLDVKDCVSGFSTNPADFDSADDGITWAEFFDAVYEAEPALTDLNAGFGYLRNEDELEPDYRFEDEPENFQEIRRKLKADPSLRWLVYGYIDDKYGWLCLHDEANDEQFGRGKDQMAFNRLMGLVIENAAKAKHSL